MKDQLKFGVHDRKEGNKFILNVITNYILKSLESFDHKNHSNIWNAYKQHDKNG
jgi:hypothetical protein